MELELIRNISEERAARNREENAKNISFGFVDERVSVIPEICRRSFGATTKWRALLPCPWYRARASSRDIAGKEAVVLSRERWSTKRGKPSQLAPRVHLCLIQCIISTPPLFFAAPSIPGYTRRLANRETLPTRPLLPPAIYASILTLRWISISSTALRLDSTLRNLIREICGWPWTMRKVTLS